MTAPDSWEDGKGFEIRHVLALVGIALILGAGGLFGYQVIAAVRAGRAIEIGRDLLLIYGVMVGVGLLLARKDALLEVLDRLPWTRKAPPSA